MDLETVIQSEVSQKEKNKYRMYVEPRKMVQMNWFARQKQTDVEKKSMDTKGGKRGRGINWEIGIDVYTLLYIKQITNKDLQYSTGNSTQYSVMTYMGKES